MSKRDDKPRITELSEDLEDFDKRLSAKLAKHRVEDPEVSGANNPWSVSLRYGSGFAGGVLVGTGLGWLADRSFGIAPWGMLVGMALGFAAGLRNIMREAAAYNAEIEAGKAPDDDGTDD